MAGPGDSQEAIPQSIDEPWPVISLTVHHPHHPHKSCGVGNVLTQSDETKSGLQFSVTWTHCWLRWLQSALLYRNVPTQINHWINAISYCGNTTKSDWVPEACKQTNYQIQRVFFVILKWFSAEQRPYVLRRKQKEQERSAFWGRHFHNPAGVHSCYVKCFICC